ncbi:UNVERIFIED_CONTAM: hypothetical protein NCL1_50037 [Trichonephila clavipes]
MATVVMQLWHRFGDPRFSSQSYIQNCISLTMDGTRFSVCATFVSPPPFLFGVPKKQETVRDDQMSV